MRFVVTGDNSKKFAFPGSKEATGKIGEVEYCTKRYSCKRLAIGCTKTTIGHSAENFGSKM